MGKIKHYRTATSGTIPDVANLDLGEIAINTTDEKLFFKSSSNKIIEIFNTIEDKKAPKSLLIYYGYPIAYEGLNDASLVAASIAKNYDIYICGDSYQDSTHEEYTSTTAVISALINLGVEVYGYIPIGVTTSNRSATVLKTAIDDWKTLNVTGIFIDEFGFDYDVTRERQVDIVTYIHSKSLKYIANATTWEDFSVDIDTNLPADWASNDERRTNFEDQNPNNVTLPRNLEDGYLIENYCINTQGALSWDYIDRVHKITTSNSNNYPLHSIAVYPESSSGVINYSIIPEFDNINQISEYIWMNAYIFGLSSTGGNGYSFGLAGGVDANIKTPITRLDSKLNPTKIILPLDVNSTTGVVTATLDNKEKTTLSITNLSSTGERSWDIALSNIFNNPNAGLISTADQQKLDSIEENADANIQTIYSTHSTGNKALVDNEYCLVSLTGSSTLTLPDNPPAFTTIYLLDTNSTFDTISLNISSVNETIMGSSDDVQLNIKNKEYKLLYTGSDWRII